MAYDGNGIIKLEYLKALGLQHKKDAEALTTLANSKVASVSAGNNTVSIGGTATAPTVAVKVSPVAGNALTLDTTEGNEGLKVIIPAAAEYSVVADADAGEYAAVYHLTKDGTNVGAPINIVKDKYFKSGTVGTVTVADSPYTGAAVGDFYIEIELQNQAEKLYIPANALVEYVTSGSAVGDMIVVAVDPTTHKVTATITDGTITLAKLETDVQTAIGKAHTHASGSKDIVTISGELSYNAENKELSYSHPTTTAVGAAFVKVGKDATGHVVIGDAIAKSDIDTLVGNAVASTNGVGGSAGLMTAADKEKLDGLNIATQAEFDEMMAELFPSAGE